MLPDRGMMADGVADLRAIRAAVEATGHAGPCDVEVFSAATWWQRDPAEVPDRLVDRFRHLCRPHPQSRKTRDFRIRFPRGNRLGTVDPARG